MLSNSFVKFCLILFLGFLSNGIIVSAQSSQKFKSQRELYKKSLTLMYKYPDSAIENGFKILNETDDIDVQIEAYFLISNGYSSKRDYEKSLSYTLKAAGLLDQTSDDILKIKILTRLGNHYYHLKVIDKAVEYLDKAERMCLKYPVRDSVSPSLGINYSIRGLIYREQLDCDIAIDFFKKGLNEIEKDKSDAAQANISIVKYNMGNCFLANNNLVQAKKHFNEALTIANHLKTSSLQGFALKGLAEVYKLEGNYSLAVETLLQAKKVSSSVSDLVLNQNIYKELSENYLQLKDLANYQIYNQMFLDTEKHLKESERVSFSDSLREKENEEKDKLNDEISNFLILIVTTIVVFSIIIIGLFFFIKRLKKSIEKLTIEVKNLQKIKK